MANEDVFNGAKTALMFYDAYASAVAEEIGMERAAALQAKVFENMGVMRGKMMKEQAGIKECDAKTAWSLIRTVPESLGLNLEVVEESPQRVVVKASRCAVYEAAHALGVDDKTIETMCSFSSNRFMDAVAKQLNPNLTFKVSKFRSTPDDPCIEEVVLSST
jgi:hypothetical protein